MSLMSLSEIEAEVNKLASKINASHRLLPTFGYSEQSGRPHIEVDDHQYHYVVAERGQEFTRVRTKDLDELLYVVFKSVTGDLAGDFELKHRAVGQDSRRLLFKHQIDLISILSPGWAERLAEHLERVLREYPFDDRADDVSSN
jgi:hypothetical protein